MEIDFKRIRHKELQELIRDGKIEVGDEIKNYSFFGLTPEFDSIVCESSRRSIVFLVHFDNLTHPEIYKIEYFSDFMNIDHDICVEPSEEYQNSLEKIERLQKFQEVIN